MLDSLSLSHRAINVCVSSEKCPSCNCIAIACCQQVDGSHLNIATFLHCWSTFRLWCTKPMGLRRTPEPFVKWRRIIYSAIAVVVGIPPKQINIYIWTQICVFSLSTGKRARISNSGCCCRQTKILPCPHSFSWKHPEVFWSSVCTHVRDWCGTWRVSWAPSRKTAYPCTDSTRHLHITSREKRPVFSDFMLHTFIKDVRYLPVQSSSILLNCDDRQSFTHSSISWRDKLSDVTFVEYTLTAMVDQ